MHIQNKDIELVQSSNGEILEDETDLYFVSKTYPVARNNLVSIYRFHNNLIFDFFKYFYKRSLIIYR